MPHATLRDVIDAWDRLRRGGAAGASSAEALALAREALAFGHPTLASEILREPARRADAGAELRYTAALALARIGAYREAEALLADLLDDSLGDALKVDALSLAGRIAKDRWARLRPGPARDAVGAVAVRRYLAAWDATGHSFPGINAATLLALTGNRDAARGLARQVLKAAQAPGAAQEAHWQLATLGEACALLGDWDAAATHYAEAARACGRQVGHLASMRRQLRLMASALRVPPELFEALAAPRVLVFTGHMIDAPGAARARFPAALEAPVAEALRQRLERLQAGFGHASLACGGDLLFCEAMLARGAELHLILPFERSDFLATSVAFAGEHWVRRFEAVLARASSLRFGVRERYLGDQALFAYAADLMQGAALLHARELEAEPLMLALVDEGGVEAEGGTRHTLGNWQRLGLPCGCIDLAAIRAAHPAALATPAPIDAPGVALRSTAVRREVHSMLFADVVGYSRLAEEDTPAFLLNFIGRVRAVVQESPRPPEFVNTWGDGLFMVFGTVQEAADFALRLRDAVRDTDWPSHGLPAGTSIRIGMHTGPVFPAQDPLVGRPGYFGSHVVRAARIEPVAAPGSIYVSAEFAGCLAARGESGFATDYLGVLPLAKGFGEGALYRLRRGDEAE
jgi:class 3 adenylate cyclase